VHTKVDFASKGARTEMRHMYKKDEKPKGPISGVMIKP
jgi:hypothetical protein